VKTSFTANFTVFTQFFGSFSQFTKNVWRFSKYDPSKVPPQSNFESKKLLDETIGPGFLYEKVFTEKKNKHHCKTA
jgi:hypothetical protein